MAQPSGGMSTSDKSHQPEIRSTTDSLFRTNTRSTLEHRMTESCMRHENQIKPQINRDFVLEMRKRFSVLDETTDRDPDVNTKWEAIKKSYNDISIKILEYRKRKHKEWFTPGN